MNSIGFLHNDLAEGEYWFREGCYITELSNGPHDERLSVARARVEPGGVTRWHRLVDTTERYVIVCGRGRAEIGDRSREVGPGDVVLIPPGTAQRICNLGADDLVFHALCTPRFRPENYQDLEPGG